MIWVTLYIMLYPTMMQPGPGAMPGTAIFESRQECNKQTQFLASRPNIRIVAGCVLRQDV